MIRPQLSTEAHGGAKLKQFIYFFLDFPLVPVSKEEVSPEEEQSSSLVQEEPQPPHIKEEQEEIRQTPEEAGGSMLTFLAVKSD